ncbi:MAG: sigma-54 dependent transcriptional regulator [Candidatus Margulisbacteria bacterium]|nr:sigma-54 dependent transcriptional regulator [Candidatus Margulisiibacteriota bacterium]
MNRPKGRILVVDDEAGLLKAYRSILHHDYDLTLVNSGKEAIRQLGEKRFDMMLLDIMLQDVNGIDLLEKGKTIDPSIDAIMVTAVHDIKDAVKAMKLGAYDYITKPFDAEELAALVGKVFERRALRKENIYLRQVLEKKGSFMELLGNSPAMRQVFAVIEKVSPTDSTVLITGESGSGKELAANAIHKKSQRAQNPFVVVNCAAIPDNLLEAELFGYEKSAFTGATEPKEGKFELAEGGTIFLDEIGCMKGPMQAKLLRVIQDGKVDRIGSSKPKEVDVRIVAATNTKIEEAIKKGEFREDLFYRLNVIRLHMPPLRERKEDIPLFLDNFLRKYNAELNKKIKGFNQEALAALTAYNWPGNVRELQNIVERVAALSEGKEYISTEELPLQSGLQDLEAKQLKDAELEFQAKYIKNVLQKTQGNQTKASEILGINRTTLIAKMKHLGIS